MANLTRDQLLIVQNWTGDRKTKCKKFKCSMTAGVWGQLDSRLKSDCSSLTTYAKNKCWSFNIDDIKKWRI